jgi:murein DD-endopeptidase MepM/ murein hydrolase activator NlpD
MTAISSYSVYIVSLHIDYEVARKSILKTREKLFEVDEGFHKVQSKLKKFDEKDKKLKDILGYKNKKTIIETNEGEDSLAGKVLNTDVDKNSVKLKIDKVIAEIELREQNYSEVEKYISKQRSVWVSTPKLWPLRRIGWVTSNYGYRERVFGSMGAGDTKDWHTGMDIAHKTGEEIVASAPGKVVFAGISGGYGNLVIINHGYGFATRYGHCSKILVKKGQDVKAGQTIALVGSTGLSTGPHLHFEVWKYGQTTDPAKFIKKK